ncbi:MAG TPA: peptidyl-prolyl cis-trans isomerase [Balneolales bacterium]|nr:peptidyl-prolyl cis-trans isomerase [Balneolales bacterium]
MRKCCYYLLVAAVIVGCRSTVKPAENVIAQIGNYAVTSQEFQAAFRQYYYRTGQAIPVNPVTMKSVLDGRFDTYVMATYAADRGWATDAWSQHRRDMIKRQIYTKEYLKHMVYDTVRVSEKDTRELFYRLNTKLRASHLYAPDKGTIDLLYSALNNGASFDSLARHTFNNAYLANHGGDVGVFGVDDMDIAFENAAYSLKVGQYSKPVRTSEGWSIVKLTGRYPKPIITESQYNREKSRLKTFEMKRNREMASREAISQTVEKLHIRDSVVRQLWGKIGEGRLSFDHYDPNRRESGLSLRELHDSLICHIEGFSFSVTDFIRESYLTPDITRQRAVAYGTFSDFVKGLAYRSYVIHRFKLSPAFGNPEVNAWVESSFNNYLENRVEDSLKASIEVTDDEMREKYYENPQQYDSPLMIDLARIVVASEKDGEKVVGLLKKGMKFSEVLRKYTTSGEDLMTGGDLGYEPVTKYGSMARTLGALKVGEIAGPLKYTPGIYYVFKCLGTKDARVANYEDVKGVLETEVRQQKFVNLRRKVLQETKKQHHAYEDLEKLENIKIEI